MGETMSNIKSPKKLIEVALPLDDINAEAAREKSIRHGHPSTLHLWWARRPLAALVSGGLIGLNTIENELLKRRTLGTSEENQERRL